VSVQQRPEDVRQAINNMEEGETIDSVSVYRRNGTAWVSSTATPPAAYGQRRDALMSSMDLNRTVTSSGNGTISVFTPVPKQPECVGCHTEETNVLGAVEVRMDEHPFQESFTQNAKASLILASIPLLFGIIVTIFAIRRTLLRPLALVGQRRVGGTHGPPARPRRSSPSVHDVQRHGRALETEATDLRDSVDQLRSDLEGWRSSNAHLLRCGPGVLIIGREPRRRRGEVGIRRTGAEVEAEGRGARPPRPSGRPRARRGDLGRRA
jgi:hypothetical protein